MSDFSSRVADVFGALDKHDPQAQWHTPTWHVSSRAVQKAGRDSDSSSDNEDDKEHQECLEIFEECHAGDDDSLPSILPSRSSCKAFEAEAEEDDFDRLATESLSRLGCTSTPKPALKTQVAEFNSYDRIPPVSGDTTPRTGCLEGEPSQHDMLVMANPGRLKGSVKKVRFREGDDEDMTVRSTSSPNTKSVSPRQRQRVHVPGSSPWDSPRMSDVLASARASNPFAQQPGSDAPHSISSPLLDQGRVRLVPEYARHPEKYTCYTLDTPIIVGSGNDGPPDEDTHPPSTHSHLITNSTHDTRIHACPRPDSLLTEPSHTDVSIPKFVAQAVRGGAGVVGGVVAANRGPISIDHGAVNEMGGLDDNMHQHIDGDVGVRSGVQGTGTVTERRGPFRHRVARRFRSRQPDISHGDDADAPMDMEVSATR